LRKLETRNSITKFCFIWSVCINMSLYCRRRRSKRSKLELL